MPLLELLWMFAIAVILIGLYGQYTKNDPVIVVKSKDLMWWGVFGVLLLIVVEVIVGVILAGAML